MKKLFFFAAMICATLSSCSKSEETTPVVETEKIPINLSIGGYTRANDSAFETGDKVGIYVVNYNNATAGTLATSGNHVSNMQFTFSGTAWTPASAIYWKDDTTHADFYAYYPYGTPTNVAAHAFSTKTDQSVEANYWASDFLWGKATDVAPTKEAVPITTNHVFSNILVYLKAGSGFTADEFAAATKSVKINNVKTDAAINLATGVATASGNANTVTPWNVGEYYRAMIVPQTVAANTVLVTITVDGVDYTFTSGATFKANKQHKFTLTVNKSSNGVNIGIGGWETDEEDYGGDAE